MSVPVIVCQVTSFENPYPLCSWMSVRDMADGYVIVSIPDVITGDDHREFTSSIVEELRGCVNCPVHLVVESEPLPVYEARNAAVAGAREYFGIGSGSDSDRENPFVLMLDADQVWENALAAKAFIGEQHEAHHIRFPFRAFWRDLLHEHTAYRLLKDSQLYRLLPDTHYRAHPDGVEALYLNDGFYIHDPATTTVDCPYGTCWELGATISLIE